MTDRNDQYRRPRPHLPREENTPPTITRRQLLSGCALLMTLAVLMVVGLTPRTARAPEAEPPAAQARTDTTQALLADCQLLQHLSYAPCGHQLTRRQTIPQELAGADMAALTDAYPDWQITAFSPGEVVMARQIGLHCPEHLVLKPDEGGLLCVFRNKYGDALALEKELNLPIGDMPDELQDKLRQGMGFDTLEALEKWLESAES